MTTRSVSGAATFDSTRRYRYLLTRLWDEARPRVAWIMLNPSSANADRDDPTIRRVVGLSRDWGFGGIDVVNLFALQTHRPERLREEPDPVGPRNDETIIAAVADCSDVIAAWGDHGVVVNPATGVARCEEVRRLVGVTPLRCLGTTAKGQPRHPLYSKAGTVPVSLD